jgi:hypothetical protein
MRLGDGAHTDAGSTRPATIYLSAVLDRGIRAFRQATGWVAAHPAVRTSWRDACEATRRIARSIRFPTRQELLGFLGHQALVNTVAWCAGLAAAGLITWFFEERSLRNLWGLIPSGHRALVSPDDYRMLLSLASFCAGLTMMVFVRHVLLRWIAEVRVVRLERRSDRPLQSASVVTVGRAAALKRKLRSRASARCACTQARRSE